MCNAFNTAKNPKNIREAVYEVESKLVRRTDQAHVRIPTGELVPMKWGFQRKGLGAVNNTRSDNLNSPMWKKAIENRRCLIPILSYYEWSGPKGDKQTHLFQSPNHNYLWIAGLWEESSKLGPCFSMLTTEANPVVSPIHHRMPAIVTENDHKKFLLEGLEFFKPGPELLTTEKVVNPLLKIKPSHIQDELF
ncbi:SOS response-associated peptidase [Akkermansiaceae bacterium]|nr:SOS response-associated peptidase [Akkermansiaceae bacterium]MDB4340948.1 SOS response-associated peptidase [Akkermansiaceae bacterium]MDB4371612.1 SOS response-associated peptidase [bacterium]MDB4523224.1 SOS response-associated peptidase [Akkermansiaceae bacterium]MDB4555873.1 SOS response-associated peptidase [Akkermansiaceae bacterium]